MLRIEESCTFPVSAEEAFDYITDLDNWPHYWPGFVRFEDREHARWGVPGGTVTPVVRLMGRDVPLHITLQEFERGRIVRYLSQQPGLADASHERHFSNVRKGAFIARSSRRSRAGSGWGSTIASSCGEPSSGRCAGRWPTLRQYSTSSTLPPRGELTPHAASHRAIDARTTIAR
jgi:hypothetical protein